MRSAYLNIAALAALGLVAAGPAHAGLCIGTSIECNRPVGEDPSTFDMLVTFALDSATLTDEAKANLRDFARAMMDERFSAARFIVEGHTDATGPDAYNVDLSVRRARVVVDFLIGEGVPEERLQAVGLGESVPRVADPLAGENRRVETRILLR